MKKFLMSAAAVAMMSGGAMAADGDTRTVGLVGDVVTVCDFELSKSTAAIDTTDFDNSQQLFSISAWCNNKTGAKVSMASANSYELRR